MLPAIALSLALTALPAPSAIDAEAHKILAQTHAQGLAIALIDDGRVQYVQAYGVRDAKGDPLRTDTVMYGASLTKTVFAFTVLQLVDRIGSSSTPRSPMISTIPCRATPPIPPSPTNTVPIRISRAIRAGRRSRRAWS